MININKVCEKQIMARPSHAKYTDFNNFSLVFFIELARKKSLKRPYLFNYFFFFYSSAFFNSIKSIFCPGTIFIEMKNKSIFSLSNPDTK